MWRDEVSVDHETRITKHESRPLHIEHAKQAQRSHGGLIACFPTVPVDKLHLDVLVGCLYDVLKLKEIYNKPFPKAIEPFLADIEVFYNEHRSL